MCLCGGEHTEEIIVTDYCGSRCKRYAKVARVICTVDIELCAALTREVMVMNAEGYYVLGASEIVVSVDRPGIRSLEARLAIIIKQSLRNKPGHFGRVAAFEVLIITNTVRELIKQDAGISQIKSACRKERMLYLQEQALRRVIEGLTSVNEVVRISKK